MTVFSTHQFQVGNSQAVRIPEKIAFPPRTESLVTREGNRIIIEPREETLGDVPALFARLSPYFSRVRPEFIEVERNW